MKSLLFVNDIRTSTLVVVALLVIVSTVQRRPWQGVLAAMAWLFGFEFLYEVTRWALGIAPRAHLGWAILAAVAIIGARLVGARASWPWLAVTAAVWIAWMLTGFHSNPEGVFLSASNEAWNEAAKTAWGLAYLIPLLNGAVSSLRSRDLDESQMARTDRVVTDSG